MPKRSKGLTRDLGGRPSLLNEEMITKLEDIFKVGGTVDEACSFAGISKMTYYRWLKDNESFVTKMEAAQHYADVVAKNVVVHDITKKRDVGTAKWWLEKRQFRDNQTQVAVQVNVVLPGELQEKHDPTTQSSE
jgi:cob(I)alamin adenosyltransferase